VGGPLQPPHFGPPANKKPGEHSLLTGGRECLLGNVEGTG